MGGGGVELNGFSLLIGKKKVMQHCVCTYCPFLSEHLWSVDVKLLHLR